MRNVFLEARVNLSLSLSASSGLIRFLKRFRGEWYLDRLIGSIKRLHLGTRDFPPPPLDRFGEMASMERDPRIGICLAQQPLHSRMVC